MSRMIVIVTGANSGLGFGICERLLLQLSRPVASDSAPQAFADSLGAGVPSPHEQLSTTELTLILACRSRERALEARSHLLVKLEAELLRRRRNSQPEEEYGRNFLESLVIDFIPLDLSSVEAVFAFCDTINKTYPYISHIFCNAGTGSFGGIDWIGAIVQMCTHPLDAVTSPTFKIQHSGVMSKDNLGWVWQCNVFSHYLMVRTLRKSLEASPIRPSRVVWISSHQALAETYDPEDWQLIKASQSYEASKYQTELLALALNHATATGTLSTGSTSTSHFIAAPGIVVSSMFYQWIGPIMHVLFILVLYIARWCGSEDHPVEAVKGAISATHAALAPLSHLPPASATVRLDAKADRRGRERVEITEVQEHQQAAQGGREALGRDVLRRFDTLCDILERKNGRAADESVDGAALGDHK